MLSLIIYRKSGGVKNRKGMLELNRKLFCTNTSYEKGLLQRQIDETDKQIDQLVYELYELTDVK